MSSFVLIVQGNSEMRSLLETAIAKLGLRSQSVATGAEALSVITDENAPRISLIIHELHRADAPALAVLREMRENLSAPIIVLADTQAFDSAPAAFDAGASDFVILPVTPERIAIAVRNALKIRALEGEIARITRRMEGTLSFSDIICGSLEMSRAVTLGRRAADLDLPVLIEGELGTGRELFAKAIHGDSDLSGKPFVMVHCADPASAANWSSRESFLESAWHDALGGMLFLDEIGDLPPMMQERLAALLAGDNAMRVGLPHHAVRLICTTSQNLIDKVKAGEFREDLYYRINVFPIWIPPLRDRMDDLPELVCHFTAQFAADEGKRIDGITDEALAMLKGYPWPGNVRQLENAVYRAVALAEGERLTVADFPQIASAMRNVSQTLMGTAPVPDAKPIYQGPAMIGGEWPPQRAITIPAAGGPTLGIPALTDDGQVRPLTAIEADLIRIALGHYRGHITEAARRLGIGRSTLYRKMREFGLEMRHN